MLQDLNVSRRVIKQNRFFAILISTIPKGQFVAIIGESGCGKNHFAENDKPID